MSEAKYQIKVVDETGEEITRDMTAEEEAAHDLAIAEHNARVQAEAEAAQAKQVILDRLGLTADEAKLLLS